MVMVLHAIHKYRKQNRIRSEREEQKKPAAPSAAIDRFRASPIAAALLEVPEKRRVIRRVFFPRLQTHIRLNSPASEPASNVPSMFKALPCAERRTPERGDRTRRACQKPLADCF